jgi:hypothetical protein
MFEGCVNVTVLSVCVCVGGGGLCVVYVCVWGGGALLWLLSSVVRYNFTINGVQYHLTTNADGIALSPDLQVVPLPPRPHICRPPPSFTLVFGDDDESTSSLPHLYAILLPLSPSLPLSLSPLYAVLLPPSPVRCTPPWCVCASACVCRRCTTAH